MSLSRSTLGQKVVVTRSCGTVGEELLRQLRASEAESILGIDHDEGGLFYQGLSFGDDERFAFRLANMRDRTSLRSSMQGCQSCAARRCVEICAVL